MVRRTGKISTKSKADFQHLSLPSYNRPLFVDSTPLGASDTIAKLILELKEEVERIKRVIAALEHLRDLPLATDQRSCRERKSVGQRNIKQYQRE